MIDVRVRAGLECEILDARHVRFLQNERIPVVLVRAFIVELVGIALIGFDQTDAIAIMTACIINVQNPEADFPNPKQTVNSHRSEEHTSELQSLMRISYAVFCLKKKKKPNQQTHQQ